MSKPATEFTLFPKLPVELQCAIWEVCLPGRRVAELDMPYEEFADTYCKLYMTSRMNSNYPVMTKVCHLSRKVAFENGGSIFKGFVDANPPCYGSLCDIGDTWFNPAMDIVHTSWDLAYEDYYDGTGDAIPSFLWFAKRGKGASIFRSLIPSLDDESPGFYARQYFDLLGPFKDYLVCMKMVSIHLQVAQVLDTNLFGRLGEERIVLVDPSDTESIEKYQTLWTRGSPLDVEAKAFFDQALSPKRELEEQVRKWTQHVQKLRIWHKYCQLPGRTSSRVYPQAEDIGHIWLEAGIVEVENPIRGNPPYQVVQYSPNRQHRFVQETLVAMPRFRPMIMFRLCSLTCYLPDPPKPKPPQLIGRGRGRGIPIH